MSKKHVDTGNSILQTNNLTQKGQQAPVGTLTEAGQQGAVVLEIDLRSLN
ncbi:MAG: hypothetical protein HOE30_04965 [Deltaproteobacteria bacterium]|jgi:hypothetical protein|nr:hypothetical protein [Deltaproteobacteria bacterium]MBT4264197.1 hypothetical protein [Deltaproteobacteria bacterium]MBT4641323.1 hypothetical protein [Deltaproteobacteria bacterium]MBT6502189.1 hypothetical protein [Deltaproteobacteria bacterium]MBT7155581.1 hypothetical protein [Deltaproteobacteria bacterium]